MKNSAISISTIIAILMAIFCMFSCSRHSAHWDTLRHADAYMEEHPDSALHHPMLIPRAVAHDEAQHTTSKDVVVVEVGVGIGFAVEGSRLDIATLAAGAGGLDGEGVPVLEV